ncbi:hypothetical protein M8C13_08935 [Crossiella sp. SN42]|uniref:hypothetical protein n=1 Tax=Crossiella sp. SN42 TaxID=2944808 RepID=UPI00207D2A47|nr:hypothetical protein [Crossiella sp. SN42]MCO1575881.1 hypothetical protein [Crossiella sp. SN42]
MFIEITLLLAYVRARLHDLRADERGYSTEAVLVTAVMVAAAIVVLAIIVRKVMAKANGITL